MKHRLKRNNSSCNKEVETFAIEDEHIKMQTSTHIFRIVMVRRAQVIKRSTKWNNPIDIITIMAYLISECSEKKSYDASMEVKKNKSSEKEEVDELTNKKKA